MRRPMSVLLLSPTGFITRSERVNELVMREGWRRAREGCSRRTFAKTYFPTMRGHQDSLRAINSPLCKVMLLRSLKLYKVRRKGWSLWQSKLQRGNYNFDNSGQRKHPGGPASNRRYSIGEMYCGGIGTLAKNTRVELPLQHIYHLCTGEFHRFTRRLHFLPRPYVPVRRRKICFLRI